VISCNLVDVSIGAGSQRTRAFALPLVLTVALTGGLLWARQALQDPIDHLATVVSMGAPPPRATDAAFDRILPAPRPQPGTGGYTFMMSNHQGPAAYDPCRPLHVVVNHERAPAGADQLVAAAVAQVSAASGLQIVVDGATDELAADSRPTVDRARYGNRWSPVLIAWTTRDRDARLGDAVGIGGSQVLPTTGGRLWNVTGSIHLDGPTMSEILSRPDGRERATAVVVHELVHVVGLGHADGDGQLMTVDGSGRTTLGEGDLRGLAELANVPCNTAF
jgi:hypothetical protein